MTKVETSQGFFQKYVDEFIPSILHHPYSIEKDKLLENFKALDPLGLERLKCILLDEVPKMTEKKDPMLMYNIFLLARIDEKLNGAKSE